MGPSAGRQELPGPAQRLRLVVSQVRDGRGRLLAEWLLLTNVRDAPADPVALFYYWRRRVESFHKLLKSARLEVEGWR